MAQAQQFWRTDGTTGTWVAGANWSAAPSAVGGSAWAPGSNAQFNATSTATFATTTVGNVTVADGATVTVTAGGTLSTGSSLARTFDIGTGATLNWTGQNVSTAANQAGFIKSGSGTWNIGSQANAYNSANSGFTLNNGTVIVGGNNSFGGANSVLTINGGTIQTSGGRSFANSTVNIGGDFTLTGTGNDVYAGAVNLGSATRVITNSITSGSRTFGGVVSGAAGSGITFSGTGTNGLSGANTYSGITTLNSGSLQIGAKVLELWAVSQAALSAPVRLFLTAARFLQMVRPIERS